MRFYLGTHEPSWLAREDLGVPLFVARQRFLRYVGRPRATVPWALDSGGFTELSRPPHRWTIEPEEYVEQVAELAESVGMMEWAAPQDHMCEPHILELTGRTVEEHQRATTDNLLRLWELGGRELGIVPVLQGWEARDYPRHIAMYRAAGVELTQEPVVGVGSVCRRQNTQEAVSIFQQIADLLGPRLHGFGLKGTAFQLGVHRYLASSDSLAWSLNARHRPPLPGCSHGRQGTSSCSNCPRWALRWRERTLQQMEHAPATLF